MSADASQNDGYQREIAASVCILLAGRVIRPIDEKGQDQEREMDANIHPKQASHRYGPASHKPSLILFYMLDIFSHGTRQYSAMRVIAGKYRSRQLRSLRGMDVRPTSDRLLETLVDVLTEGNPDALVGTVWLDLFAGTGAVGIEALSRGAKEAHFVENSGAAVETIRRNLNALGISQGVDVIQHDLPRALSRLERQGRVVDVVFLDPPYRMKNSFTVSLSSLAESSLISAKSVVIAEHEKQFDPGAEHGALRKFRRLIQGSAALSFYQLQQK